MKPVSVIDYGLGNLFSVRRALESCGADVKIISSTEEVNKSQRVVLPGVGAFSDGIAALKERGLSDSLCEHVKSGRPLLGICLGMQLLFSQGEEFGQWSGLGLVEGKVKEIPKVSPKGLKMKVPHIGWSRVHSDPTLARDMFRNLGVNPSFYFVHSFHGLLEDSKIPKAWTDYGGAALTAAFIKDSLWGCQFHPEKSGPGGLQVLKNFLDL
jgi:imidazole glycerol-phosphate synthase subunit HisH